MMPSTPAQAYWNQRQTLAARRERILDLVRAVGQPVALAPYQWAQLIAYALEFQPDLLLELGRSYGNSTCALVEAANLLGAGRCRVLSLCLADTWERETLPKVEQIVPADWFAPLRALREDIVTFDFRTALAEARRILIFWDAHGFEVAECVLGRLLPQIADRPHVVTLHDMSDARYSSAMDQYGSTGLWKGERECAAYFRLGHICSHVAQAISVVDFTSRNKLSLESADHSYQTELASDSVKLSEMRKVLGDELFSLQGHWFWFTLNEHSGPFTFPRFDPSSQSYQNRFEQQQQEQDRLRQQNERLRQEIARLHSERKVYETRVTELTQSRWRRLGRKIGIARKASWE
jgi:hypothetical protein